MLIQDINIIKLAEPLVEMADELNVLKSPITDEKELDVKLGNKLNALRLSVEDASLHLNELDKETSGELLKGTGKTIEDIYAIDNFLSERNYLNSRDLMEKFKSLFRALYRFESFLHRNTYKDLPVNKTPREIVGNISKINRSNLPKTGF